ncbi:MAG TPA: MFS transporter, partial [Xanthobacteraceae bacterium]|nr:MFS transporter [Xanthobacteraceae bacterium]
VRGFIERHRSFAAVPPEQLVTALGERAFMFVRAVLSSSLGILMTPRRTDTDGFFVAALERRA